MIMVKNGLRVKGGGSYSPNQKVLGRIPIFSPWQKGKHMVVTQYTEELPQKNPKKDYVRM